MKKLILFFLLTAASCAQREETYASKPLALTEAESEARDESYDGPIAPEVKDGVFVCMSSKSVAYHASSNCAGLNHCSHTVKELTVADAQQAGKRPCKKCYR